MEMIDSLFTDQAHVFFVGRAVYLQMDTSTLNLVKALRRTFTTHAQGTAPHTKGIIIRFRTMNAHLILQIKDVTGTFYQALI